jgi:uncharacterized repeat protein (TIGR03803 family)
MKHNASLGSVDAALLTIALIPMLLVPNASARNKYKSLHMFNGGNDGRGVQSGLTLDQKGNLYGTTGGGGPNNGGTVFKLSPNADGSWTESVLYSFCSLSNCGDGAEPFASLILDHAGNLYGTTEQGGTNYGGLGGTVFSLTPNLDGTWTESVLYDFCSLSNCGDGIAPYASLILDQEGSLYGTTIGGGANQEGTVFKLTPNVDGTWTESVLYSFCSVARCFDGRNPVAALTSDQAGNLYGTTQYGGNSSGNGTVFKLTLHQDGSWTHQVLHSFCSRSNCSDGGFPMGAVIFDQAGNLYGTTREWPAGGLVFELAQSKGGGWTEQVLHTFCFRTSCSYGDAPMSSLIFDQAGNLYGTTAIGGNTGDCNFGCGVVFRLTPSSKGRWKETVLHRFADHPGAIPLAGVIFDAAGNLFGTTFGDVNKTQGSVFEIAP